MINLSNENIVHIKKDDVEYIQFKKLNEFAEISHCYTLRKNNMSFKADKSKEDLDKNYDIIYNHLGIGEKVRVVPHQTHTNNVENVEDASQELENTDGVITNKNNIALCTLSADCTAIIFYDPVKHVIGNVHSGWKGTVQKICQKAVSKMIEEYGCKSEDIICAINPHIRKCHFEVEEDVMQIFKDTFGYMEQIDNIIQKKVIQGKQKYNIDTTLINKLLLKEMGIKEENVIDSGICTVCNKEYFHSYRVDKEKSGRNVTIIALR